MGLVSLVCPGCNGVLELDDNRKEYFCQFCGSKVVLEEKKIEINGNISLDGAIAADNLIERGYQYIEDRDFINAKSSFNRALDINARKWKAFIGLLLCELEITEIAILSDSIRPMTDYENFNKALRFAEGDDKEMLEEISSQTDKNFEEARVVAKKTLDELYDKKIRLSDEYEKLAVKGDTFIKLKKAFKPLMIVLWIATIIAFCFRMSEFNKGPYVSTILATVFTILFFLALAVTIAKFVFGGNIKGIQEELNSNTRKQNDVLSRIATLKAEYCFIKFDKYDENS